MSVLHLSCARSGNAQVVSRPLRTDAIGAALRGAFGADDGLPPPMAQLLQRLDRR